MKRSILLSLFFLLILNSCTVQKRTYNRGFSINWHINNGNYADKSKSKHSNYSKQNEETKRNNIENQDIKLEDTIHTSKNRASEVANKSVDSSLCDLIILKSGEEVLGRVTHVEHDLIKYKKCDNPDGPTYSIDKSSVFIIKYSNGTRDLINVIEDKVNDNVNPPSTTKTKVNAVEENEKGDFFGAASSALILFSIVLLYFKIVLPIIIFTIIVAFAFGIIGLVKSQSSLAIFGTIFSLLMGLLLLNLDDII